MEVHHHAHTSPDPDSHRGLRRKKWTHYFWEFFMLFLAVTAGFLVENWRHHRLEKSYEKQYMKSLVEDLESDLVQLKDLNSLFTTIDKKEDSLIVALKRPDIITNAALAYPFLGYPLDGYAFHRSERTIQQLKNAGGLRLIHSVEVSNRINQYDENYRKSGEINGVMISTYHNYTAVLNKVADAEQMGYPYKTNFDTSISYFWITDDPRELKTLFNYVVNFQWVTRIYMGQLQGLKKDAEELIRFLKTEYNL